MAKKPDSANAPLKLDPVTLTSAAGSGTKQQLSVGSSSSLTIAQPPSNKKGTEFSRRNGANTTAATSGGVATKAHLSVPSTSSSSSTTTALSSTFVSMLQPTNTSPEKPSEDEKKKPHEKEKEIVRGGGVPKISIVQQGGEEEDQEGDIEVQFDIVDRSIIDKATGVVHDPTSTVQTLALFKGKEAEEYYCQKCKEFGVKPNHSFIKNLLGEISLINFERSYFGERGMAAIAPTLQRIPVIELNLGGTGLCFEDTGLLQEALVHHPTLTSLDLRRMAISQPSARRWLSLVSQNKRISTMQLDEGTPKNILIQRQCLANANIYVFASCCVVCGLSMIHSLQHRMEANAILMLVDRLGGNIGGMEPVEFETIMRALIACIQINDGILFVCSLDCMQAFADDLVNSAYFVKAAILDRGDAPHPKNLVISHIATEMANKLVKALQHGPVIGPKKLTPEDWVQCDVCGDYGHPLPNPQQLFLQLAHQDLSDTSSVYLRPSAFSRLVHTFLQRSYSTVCSKKCVRMMVRYCILGSGGALDSRPCCDDEPVTSLVDDFPLPPERGFAVVNFNKTVVFDQREEDVSCACTVASVLGDIDHVPMDPYFIFAAGRHLSKRREQHFGVEMRDVCRAVIRYGSLPTDSAAFEYQNSNRAHYCDWLHWQQLNNFPHLRKKAFSHRKQAFFSISGPHENLFDNVRATLWAFRHQERGIVTVMKWRTEWFNLPSGIIPGGKFRGGFRTAVKIVGQAMINSTPHLIVQPNFGRSTGNRGFFYCCRSTINRACKQQAFVFLDTRSVMESCGVSFPHPQYFSLIPKECEQIVRSPTQVFDLIAFISTRAARMAPARQRSALQTLFQQFPPALLFAYFGSSQTPNPQQLYQLEYLRQLFASDGASQLAFYWSEVMPATAVQWICTALQQCHEVVLARTFAELQRSTLLKRERMIDGASAEELWKLGEAIDIRDETSQAGSRPGSANTKKAPKKPKKAAAQPYRSKTVHQQQQEALIEKQQKMLDYANQTSREEHEEMEKAIVRAKKAQQERRVLMAMKKCRQSKHHWVPAAPAVTEKQPTEGSGALRPLASFSMRAGSFSNLKSAAATSDPQEIGSGLNIVPSNFDESAAHESVPVELIGKKWSAINVPVPDTSCMSRTILLFQGRYVCRYDINQGAVISPLRPMKEDHVFASFPFANGFDAVLVCTAVNPWEAYFFSESHWIRWDLRRNACLAGPFHIDVHYQFRSLPDNIRKNIYSVLEIPGKKSVLFFGNDGCCVEYDFNAMKPLLPIQEKSQKEKEQKLHSLPLSQGVSSSSSSAFSSAFVTRKFSDCADSFGESLVRTFPLGTTASLMKPNWPMDSTTRVVLGENGRVLHYDFSAKWDVTPSPLLLSPLDSSNRSRPGFQTTNNTVSEEKVVSDSKTDQDANQSIPSPSGGEASINYLLLGMHPFRNLPSCFLQSITRGVLAVQQSLVNNLPVRRVINVKLFNPTQEDVFQVAQHYAPPQDTNPSLVQNSATGGTNDPSSKLDSNSELPPPISLPQPTHSTAFAELQKEKENTLAQLPPEVRSKLHCHVQIRVKNAESIRPLSELMIPLAETLPTLTLQQLKERQERANMDDEEEQVGNPSTPSMPVAIENNEGETSIVVTVQVSETGVIRVPLGSTSKKPAIIEFDFGPLNHKIFGYFQLVLNLPCNMRADYLIKHPMHMIVESSFDGVGWAKVGWCVVGNIVSDLFWEPTHHSRYWRILLSDCPPGIEISRTAWHTVHWVADASNYNLSAPFSCRNETSVQIFAPQILREPYTLLDTIPQGPVFSTPPAPGCWYPKHCCIPLLPPAKSCLLFVGDTFVEWDLLTKEVVGGHTCSMTTHPAFFNLPFPFRCGLDAAFYPDPLHSTNVCLVTHDWIVEYDLTQGKVIDKPLLVEECFWLKGLPPSFFSRIDAIVNVWERPGQVIVFSGDVFVRWNILTRTVIEGPMPIVESPILHCSDLFNASPSSSGSSAMTSASTNAKANGVIAGKGAIELLTAASFPQVPYTNFLFSQDRVAAIVSNSERRLVSVNGPWATGRSPDFHRMLWYLPWGQVQKQVSVVIDFFSDAPLLVGLTMQSTRGVSPRTKWDIHCSHDLIEWKYVATHEQDQPISVTKWSVKDLTCCQGHRFWSLKTSISDGAASSVLTSGAVGEKRSVEYSQIIFHCLPSQKYRIQPVGVQALSCVSSDSTLARAFRGDVISFCPVNTPGVVAPTVSSKKASFHSKPTADSEEEKIASPSAVVMEELLSKGEQQPSESFLSSPSFSFTSPTSGATTTAVARQTAPVRALIVDYGTEACEFVGVSLSAIASEVSDVWVVSYSDDAAGRNWVEVGEWRVRTLSCQLGWAPAFPHRFWRLELRASLANDKVAEYCSFAFHEYAGPVIQLDHPLTSSLEMLSTLFFQAKSAARLLIPGIVNETVTIDFKGDPQNIVGVALVADVDTFCFNTTFAIEYSDDREVWWNIASAVVCDDIGMSAWENEGPHRYWRLRVLRHYGGEAVRLKRLELMKCGPTLLRTPGRGIQSRGNVYFSEKLNQLPFVAVRAFLTPRSVWIVEKMEEANSQWTAVGILRNTAGISQACQVGWPPSNGTSTYWRLRHLYSHTEAPASPGSPAERPPVVVFPEAKNVQWLVFADSKWFPVDFSGVEVPSEYPLEWKDLQVEEEKAKIEAQKVVVEKLQQSRATATNNKELPAVQPQESRSMCTTTELNMFHTGFEYDDEIAAHDDGTQNSASSDTVNSPEAMEKTLLNEKKQRELLFALNSNPIRSINDVQQQKGERKIKSPETAGPILTLSAMRGTITYCFPRPATFHCVELCCPQVVQPTFPLPVLPPPPSHLTTHKTRGATRPGPKLALKPDPKKAGGRGAARTSPLSTRKGSPVKGSTTTTRAPSPKKATERQASSPSKSSPVGRGSPTKKPGSKTSDSPNTHKLAAQQSETHLVKPPTHAELLHSATLSLSKDELAYYSSPETPTIILPYFVVEFSEDGINYVPVAKKTLSSAASSKFSTAFWELSVQSQLWRIRIEAGSLPVALDLNPENIISLSSVQWFFKNGVTSSNPSPPSPLGLTNVFSRQLVTDEELPSREEIWRRRRLKAGSAANSFLSGFIPEESEVNLDPYDQLALYFNKLQKAVQKEVTRSIKEQKGGTSDNKRGGGGGNNQQMQVVNACKVMELLSSNGGSPEVAELQQQLGSVGMSDFKAVKDSGMWPLSKIEYRGTLVQPLVGFVGGPASFSVRWTIPSLASVNLSALCNVAPLDSRVAVAMFSFVNANKEWMARVNFPTLAPFMYEIGLSGGLFTAVFSTGKVKFTPEVPFARPNGGNLISDRPYTIYRGANFIFELNHKSCYSDLLSLLSYFTEKENLKQPILSILHTPHCSATSAALRFSLPCNTNLGIEGLAVVGSIDFELQWEKNHPSKLCFICQGEWSLMGEVLSLIINGTIEQDTPEATLRAYSLTGEIKNPAQLVNPTALINPAFTASLLMVERHFACNEILLMGELQFSTMQGLKVPCEIIPPLGNNQNDIPQVTLKLTNSSTSNLVSVCCAVAGLKGIESEPWLDILPLTVSVSLTMSRDYRTSVGHGFVVFFGCSGTAVLTVSEDAIAISAKLQPPIRIGNIIFEGNEDIGGLITFDFITTVGSPASIKLDGSSVLLSSSAMPSQLQITQDGTICTANNDFLDVKVKSDSFLPLKSTAKVRVQFDLATLDHSISTRLLFTPMIARLVANDIPFAFRLLSVSAEDCDLERNTLLVTFRGVLLGSGFEVMVPLCSPKTGDSFIVELAQRATNMILEQCSENLWITYHEFGFSTRTKESREETEFANTLMTPAFGRNHLKGQPRLTTQDGYPVESFLARWGGYAAEGLRKMTENSIETVD